MCISQKQDVMNNSLLFTFSIKYCIGPKKTKIEILMDLHVLRVTESKKVIFDMSSVCLSVCVCLSVSVCLSVCLSVYTITQKIIELSQPNLVFDLI